jgi:hypothetical protein
VRDAALEAREALGLAARAFREEHEDVAARERSPQQERADRGAGVESLAPCAGCR